MSNLRRAVTLALAGVTLGIAAAPAAAQELRTPVGPVAAPGHGALFSEAARVSSAKFPSLKIKGSKKHKIYIDGFAGTVNVAVYKGKRSSYYSKKGRASGKVLRADFGKFGKVDVTFEKKGKERKKRPRNCTGKPDRVQRGVWKGTIKFKGEGGYTKVNAGQARGTVTKWGNYTCTGGGGYVPTVYVGADWALGSQGASIFAQQRKGNPNARPQFFASQWEKDKKVYINRYIEHRGQSGDLTWEFGATEDENQATVTLNKGFIKGEGNLLGASWTGDLEGKFLGHTAALAGPQFWGSLYEY